MTFNVGTPINAADSPAVAEAKMVVAAEVWLGSGQASGGNAPATWADMRTKLNLILTAFGKPNLGNNEGGDTVRAKINGIIDAEALLSGTALAWWNADRSDLISLSGSQVTAWTDSIGGYSAAQGTSALRPIYSATSFNGSPGLTFDGSDDYLELASQPFPSGSGESEMWANVQQDALPADTSTRMILSYGGDVSAGRRTIARLVVSGNNVLRAQVGDGSTTVNATVVGDFSGRNLVRADVGPTQTGVALNGGAVTNTAVIPSTGASRLRIGAISNTSPLNYWNGKMRDMMITGPLSGNAPTYLANFLLPRRAL